jgi:hypothetical protein
MGIAQPLHHKGVPDTLRFSVRSFGKLEVAT